MSYFVGRNARCLCAVNAATAGVTFGGTPGAYECMKIATGGGFKVEPRNAKLVVDEVDVDPRDIVTGGIYYTITVDLVGSYSYREHILQLIAGGAISSGVSAPYVHTFANADQVLCGAIAIEYSLQSAQASAIIKELYTNFCVTAISFSESPEGYLTMSVSGIATALERTTDETALTTVNHSEVISWSHLTASLNGTTTYRLGDVGIELAAALTEGEFDHAAATPAVLNFIGRSGMREVKYSFGLRMNEQAQALIGTVSTAWTGANSFVWNNSGTAAAERELSFVFGVSYIEGAGAAIGGWGRETRPITMRAIDRATGVDEGTSIIAIKVTNARETIA